MSALGTWEWGTSTLGPALLSCHCGSHQAGDQEMLLGLHPGGQKRLYLLCEVRRGLSVVTKSHHKLRLGFLELCSLLLVAPLPVPGFSQAELHVESDQSVTGGGPSFCCLALLAIQHGATCHPCCLTQNWVPPETWALRVSGLTHLHCSKCQPQ